MVKFRKYSGRMTIDLTDLEGLVARLEKARDETMSELVNVSRCWAKDTEGMYSSGISYAHGFKSHPKHSNKGTFYDVEFSKDNKNSIRVVVGHSSFIARFLEVGTSQHDVYPTIRGKKRVITVKGIEGSKALAKTFQAQRDALARDLENTINNLLQGK